MQRVGIPTARFVRTESAEAAIARARAIRLSGRREGRRTGRRQRRDHRAQPRGSRSRRSLARSAPGDRRIPARRRSQLHRRSATAAAWSRSKPPRITKPFSTATPAPTPAAWAPTATAASSPPPIRQRILDTIIEPAVRATHFTGFLYAGLMMTADGPKVIEFNVRLGDPETQPLMHRLEGGLRRSSAARGDRQPARYDAALEAGALGVCSPGGARLSRSSSHRRPDHRNRLPPKPENVQVFHAGTKLGPQGLETSGGRVLGVTASGPDLASAVRNTYAAVEKIHFDGNALPQRHRAQGFDAVAPSRAALDPCYNRSVCGDVAQMDRAAAS